MTVQEYFLHSFNTEFASCLTPVETLSGRTEDAPDYYVIGRISAFSKFAGSVEELEDWIDREQASVLEKYRSRFAALVNRIAVDSEAYCHFDSYTSNNSIFRVLPDINIREIASRLSENCSADIFVPRHELALLGHDDFGCHIVICKEIFQRTQNWLTNIANDVGLHMLLAKVIQDRIVAWTKAGC